MRSGSTLLAHILASHPEIAGAGETHIVYNTPSDLPKLVLRTCELLHRPILREQYMVDQINHPYVTDDVLLSNRLHRCVILIREPAATLKSTMKLLACDEKEALTQYASRLAALTRYGMRLKQRAMLLQYDDLVDRSAETLTVLTAFLGLHSPLTPNYATHRMTARVEGFGDPSSNIKAGRVIRTQGHTDVTLSDEILVTARAAWKDCQAQLQSTVALAARNEVLLRALNG
jgi:hypothetical protein